MSFEIFYRVDDRRRVEAHSPVVHSGLCCLLSLNLGLTSEANACHRFAIDLPGRHIYAYNYDEGTCPFQGSGETGNRFGNALR
jgi:hypothetical protein